MIRVLYVLIVVVAALGSLVFLIGGIASGGPGAIVALIGAPIMFLLYVLIGRVYMEVVLVMFRIADNTTEMTELLRKERS